MSRLALCVFVVALAFASGAPEWDAEKHEPKNNVNDCKHKEGDKVLSLMQVTDGGHKFGQGYLDLNYPPKGAPEDFIINCITIKDLRPEYGATASITEGSPGSTKVAIHLESRYSKALSFSIRISGQSAAATTPAEG